MNPDAPQLHRVLHAIGPAGLLALIGYAAGKPTLYVPAFFQSYHPMAVLFGEGPYLQLIANVGGETICLPSASGKLEIGRRLREIHLRLKAGVPMAQIAREVGVSYTRVAQISRALTPACNPPTGGEMPRNAR